MCASRYSTCGWVVISLVLFSGFVLRCVFIEDAYVTAHER